MDLSWDYLWLVLQVGLLGGVVVREIRKPKGRNLVLILVASTVLILVQGQAFWIFNRFQEEGATELTHLFQDLSLAGARSASFLAGWCVVCFVASYAALRLRRRRLSPAPPPPPPPADDLRPSPFTYVALVGWMLLFAAFLFGLAGGLGELLTKPGQTMTGGLTMAMLLTGIGRMPAMQKLASKQGLNVVDLLLFSFCCALYLVNSRILAAFLLLQVFLAINYARGEVPRKALVGLAVMGFAVFIVFGLYRDFTSFNDEVHLDELLGFYATRSGEDSSLNWFYRANVEGFTGLAGIITHEAREGRLPIDYGLSTLRVIFQFIPFGFRHDPDLPFAALQEHLQSLYPYAGSVVPSGLENAYGHFGPAGVLGLGLLLGVLCHAFDAGLRAVQGRSLVLILLAVHALQLIRGSFVFLVFFALSDLILLAGYRLLLRATGVRPPATVPRQALPPRLRARRRRVLSRETAL